MPLLPLPRRGLRGLRGAFEGPETQTNAAQGAATLGFVLFSVLFGLTSNDGEEPLPHMCDTGERSAQDASNIQICFVFSLGWKNNTPALSKECCRWHGRHGGGAFQVGGVAAVLPVFGTIDAWCEEGFRSDGG